MGFVLVALVGMSLVAPPASVAGSSPARTSVEGVTAVPLSSGLPAKVAYTVQQRHRKDVPLKLAIADQRLALIL